MTKKSIHFFSNEDYENFMVTAYEGGINYWANYYSVQPSHKLSDVSDKHKKKYHNQIYYSHTGGLNPYYSYLPVIADEDYFVAFKDVDGDNGIKGKIYKLTKKSLQRGLDIIKSKYPRDYKDLKDENYDADTADILVQCSLFGEIVYC